MTDFIFGQAAGREEKWGNKELPADCLDKWKTGYFQPISAAEFDDWFQAPPTELSSIDEIHVYLTEWLKCRVILSNIKSFVLGF